MSDVMKVEWVSTGPCYICGGSGSTIFVTGMGWKHSYDCGPRVRNR